MQLISEIMESTWACHESHLLLFKSHCNFQDIHAARRWHLPVEIRQRQILDLESLEDRCTLPFAAFERRFDVQ